MRLVFKESADRSFHKIDFSIRQRILLKLKFYIAQENPLQFAEPLKNPRFGSWRFRIGDYRVLFDLEDDVIVVLKVGHRKDIYR